MKSSIASDPTGPLSEFIVDLQYSDLPDSIKRRVQLLVVDAFANALAGWDADETWAVLRLAKRIGGEGKTTVIGGSSLSPASAVLLNGYLITAVSSCDVYRPALCHVAPEVFPPAFAIAEQIGATGKEFLLAIAIGLEITTRLGLGLNYSAFRSRGWHSPGVIGPFGGAAAVGSLLDLEKGKVRNALSLAGGQASGTFSEFGTAGVKIHQSHGALAGFMAGLLASEGFESTKQILVHEDGGLFNAMSDGGAPEKVTEKLGEHWELENISLRLWPTAAALQSLISALLNLIENHDISPEHIEQVLVSLPQDAYEMNGNMGWQDSLHARLSARFVTSVVLHDRECWLKQFDSAHLENSTITKFAESRIDVKLDTTIEGDGSKVLITLSDGNVLMEKRDFAKGDPSNPLTEEDVFRKLAVYGAARLESESLNHLVVLLKDLCNLDNVQQLSNYLGR